MQYIDHSRGRIELLDGYTFYSPNPPKKGGSVVLPQYYNPEHHVFSLQNGKPEIQWSDLLRPRWYAPRTAFLSFITSNPTIAGYPFNRLARIPAQDCTDGKYALKKEGRDSWTKLEQDLLLATAHLRHALRFKHFIDRPFAPGAFGFYHSSPTRRIMEKRAWLSRDWFQIWIALLSYFIACSGIDDGDSIPFWYTLLQSKGFDEPLLNGIRSSDAVKYSPNVPRVGTFLDLDNADTPPPRWFIGLGVLVWYHLSKSLIDTARSNPNGPLSYLVPPSELMAAQLKPSLTTAPRLSILSSSSDLPDSYISWQDFFARRAVRNEQILRSETAKECEVRLNRERQPPTRKTKVFEWMTGDDPEDNRLYRRSVPSKFFEDVFESYASSQKRYDSFRNEWDLCEEFGPVIPGGGYDDDSDDGYDDNYFQQPVPEDIDVEELTPGPRPTSPIRFTAQSDAWRPPFPVLNNPIKSLSLRYGFIHPLTPSAPLPARFTDGQKKSWTDILHLGGLSIETEKRFPVEEFFDQNLIGFFDVLSAGRRPAKNQWDLDRDNHHSLFFSDSLRNVSEGPLGGYIIQFSSPLFPWRLWLSNPVDVLHICRVQQELRNDYNTAEYLVENGFRFRTLLPLGSTRLLTHAPLKLPVVPIRSLGYTFTRKDYDAYEQQCATLLDTPRARAFLLRGGIAWRLARDVLSLDDALNGPSSPLDIYRSGYYVRRNGEYWGDNDISAAELNLLSGLYICFMGKGDQKALKSWWPLQTTWEKETTLANYGHWTDYNEIWYQRRLRELREGSNVQPLAESEWRSRLRGNMPKAKTNSIRDNNLKFAAEVVRSHITPEVG